MDRRTLIAVVLALATYWVWSIWIATQYPQPEITDTDELALVEADSDVPVPNTVTPDPILPEPVVPEPDLPIRTVSFNACGTEAVFTTDGGTMHSLVLPEYPAPYDMQPLYMWVYESVTGEGGKWKPYGDEPGHEQLLSEDAELFAMGSGALDSPSPRVEVLEDSPGHLVLRGMTRDGIEVTRRFTVRPGETCLVDVETSWKNRGQADFTGNLWLGLHDVMDASTNRYGNAVQPYAMVDESYEYTNFKKLEEPELVEGPVDWMSISDRYFALVLIPESEHQGSLFFSAVERSVGPLYGEHYVVSRVLSPGEVYDETFTMYVGPKELKVLEALHPRLDKLVELGWFAFFGRMLLWLLQFFHGYLGDWGWSIIGMTVFVKMLFFPLTHKSFKSSQAMQAIQPELQEIREELKDQPEELNRRTMALFSERGVNPLGGCLPMMIQFPVWIALYRVLLSSVELYHTEFLFMKDLSAVDPYGILPAIVVVLMLIQQQFMPTGNMDPTQARMMKMMPLIFGFFFFTFPSGLVLYIFVNMVLTILQQWMIRRTYKAPASAAAAN